MKKTLNAVTVLILSVMIILGSTAVAPVQAAGFSTAYPNTYKNTGMGADDIVGVAKTQVGYKQNSAGTKYGDWYNKIFVNQPWCAMFVSWCAEQAGISQTTIQKFASCSIGVNWFKSIGRWQDSQYYGGNYTPKKGDIVFYRNGGSSSISDHVGIVAGINGIYLNVIEGNATNQSCCEFKTNSSRTLSNKYVIGYGTPDYSGEIKGSSEDEPTDYEEWQITDADSLMLRESYTTSSKKLAAMTKGKILKVTEFKMTEDYLWGKTVYNEKEGWCALDYCTYIWGNIDGVYYQMPPSVSPDKYTLYAGYTKKLTLTNGLGATFSSTDKTIAKVNKNGKITAVSQGKATIKCTTQTGTAKCVITVKNPYINEKSPIVAVGDETPLTMTGAKGDITWTSDDEKIATVDSEGKVKGIGAGKTTINTEVNGIKDNVEVEVTKYPTTYENFTVKTKTYLYPEHKTENKIVQVPVGTAIKVREVKYTDTYTWGKITYNNKDGWIILNRCKYKNGSIGGKICKTRPFLEATSKTIYLKAQCQIVIKSATGDVTYTSRKPSIATVDEKGLITGQKAGTTYIDVKNGTTNLKFKIKVNNPKITKPQAELSKGKTLTLMVKGGDGDIKWKSSDKSVAKVDKNGKVTALAFGEVTITATRNKISSACKVKVYDPILSAKKRTIYQGATKKLSVKQCSKSTVVWKSLNKKIAKVNSKGVITGVKAGNTTVTATVDGVTLSCLVIIKKPPVQNPTTNIAVNSTVATTSSANATQ